jgi:hypothetical protein
VVRFVEKLTTRSDRVGDAFAEGELAFAGFSLLFEGDLLSLKMPAAPLTAKLMRQRRTPTKVIWPDVSWTRGATIHAMSQWISHGARRRRRE